MIEVTQGGTPATYEELHKLWQPSIDKGRLDEAGQIIERVLVWAREHADERLIDSVACARAAVLIELRQGDTEVPRLREILLRSNDPANCRMAAYNISMQYEFSRNYKKSLFYARIACDHARQQGRTDWIAYTCNQLGNALLGESFVEEACRNYETAVRLVPDPGVWRAVMLDNLGYCRVLQRRFAEGYSNLYESLRLLRRFSAERWQVLPLLDLCFAHLETRRYLQAQRQGMAALELAEKIGEADDVKKALYLLGETANLMGDTDAASGYFTRLQRDYFPESPFLPGFLLAVDVRKMVNLHA